jgi:hypothetical protein
MSPPPRYFALLGLFLAPGCVTDGGYPSQARFEIAVAPLTLPGVGKICYDLRVSDGSTQAAPAVWSKGTPGLNGGTPDAAAICSSNFGNGSGGDITFVGTCVASPTEAGQDYRTNRVTLWIDGIYDGSNTYLPPTGPQGWQNPCPDGCTLTAPCRENADTSVAFNLTILREANQGFFDIGVNFSDIFCSAKVDCVGSDGQALKLLFPPSGGARDTTIVSALACTGGPGGTTTELYRDDLVITCGTAPSAKVSTLDPSLGKGNAYTATTPDSDLTDAIWQYAIYAGDETLSCGGQPCNKRYWNVALGLDEDVDGCVLRTRMTAGQPGTLSDFATPVGTTYPYIDVDVPLTDVAGLACTKHPLNGGNGVSTVYTPIDAPASFGYGFLQANLESALTPIVEDGLILHFNADDPASYGGTGATVVDLAAPATNATLNNSVGYDSSAGALTFNGTNQYAQVGARTSDLEFQASTPFTVGVLAYITENTGTGYVITNQFTDAANVTSAGWELSQQSGYLSFSVGGNSGGLWKHVRTSTTTFANEVYNRWAYIVAVNPGAGQPLKLLINGVDKSYVTAAGAYAVNYTAGNHRVTLGMSRSNAGGYLSGKITHAHVYGRTLNASETTQNLTAMRDLQSLPSVTTAEVAGLVNLNFEDPMRVGWTFTGCMQVMNSAVPPCGGGVNASGTKPGSPSYAGSGDNGTGTAISNTFIMPSNAIRFTFLRAGGAGSPSGFYVKRASDGAVLCSHFDTTDTDTFFAGSCGSVGSPLSAYAGTAAYIEIWDHISSGWGKVYIDDIALEVSAP